MLQKLASHIADCFERAAAADRRADATADPDLRRDYREIGKGWRHLAASYQFAESLERFILDTRRAKETPPKPPSPPE